MPLLPTPVDSDAVHASVDHDVLAVAGPDVAQALRRRIPIGHRR